MWWRTSDGRCIRIYACAGLCQTPACEIETGCERRLPQLTRLGKLYIEGKSVLDAMGGDL